MEKGPWTCWSGKGVATGRGIPWKAPDGTLEGVPEGVAMLLLPGACSLAPWEPTVKGNPLPKGLLGHWGWPLGIAARLAFGLWTGTARIELQNDRMIAAVWAFMMTQAY